LIGALASRDQKDQEEEGKGERKKRGKKEGGKKFLTPTSINFYLSSLPRSTQIPTYGMGKGRGGVGRRGGGEEGKKTSKELHAPNFILRLLSGKKGEEEEEKKKGRKGEKGTDFWLITLSLKKASLHRSEKRGGGGRGGGEKTKKKRKGRERLRHCVPSFACRAEEREREKEEEKEGKKKRKSHVLPGNPQLVNINSPSLPGRMRERRRRSGEKGGGEKEKGPHIF